MLWLSLGAFQETERDCPSGRLSLRFNDVYTSLSAGAFRSMYSLCSFGCCLAGCCMLSICYSRTIHKNTLR